MVGGGPGKSNSECLSYTGKESNVEEIKRNRSKQLTNEESRLLELGPKFCLVETEKLRERGDLSQVSFFSCTPFGANGLWL
jgi:hypothetical protein